VNLAERSVVTSRPSVPHGANLFAHDTSRTDAVKITKLETEVFHHESLKCIYFEVKWSLTGQGHKALINSPSVVFCTFVSDGVL